MIHASIELISDLEGIEFWSSCHCVPKEINRTPDKSFGEIFFIFKAKAPGNHCKNILVNLDKYSWLSPSCYQSQWSTFDRLDFLLAFALKPFCHFNIKLPNKRVFTKLFLVGVVYPSINSIKWSICHSGGNSSVILFAFWWPLPYHTTISSDVFLLLALKE